MADTALRIAKVEIDLDFFAKHLLYLPDSSRILSISMDEKQITPYLRATMIIQDDNLPPVKFDKNPPGNLEDIAPLGGIKTTREVLSSKVFLYK